VAKATESTHNTTKKSDESGKFNVITYSYSKTDETM